MRVAVNGGPPLKITDDVGNFLGATWASDDTLVYSTGAGLYRMSAGGGGTPELLTPDPEGNQGATYIAPSFLPGERAVLMSINNGTDERVAALDLDTGEIKTLVEGGVQNPRYAATGHVVYARGTTLMAVPFDPDELAVTGEPVTVQQGIRQPGAGTAADFAISASGTLAYVPGTDEVAKSEVVWVDRDGRISENALSEPIAQPFDPRLSPDGGRLVIRAGAPGTLWVYDLSGRPPIPLSNVGDNRLPVWSPDGTEIAFVSNRDGGYALYRVPADGSLLVLEPLRLLGQAGAPAAWSSDGELVIMRPQGPDIFVMSFAPDARSATSS